MDPALVLEGKTYQYFLFCGNNIDKLGIDNYNIDKINDLQLLYKKLSQMKPSTLIFYGRNNNNKFKKFKNWIAFEGNSEFNLEGLVTLGTTFPKQNLLDRKEPGSENDLKGIDDYVESIPWSYIYYEKKFNVFMNSSNEELQKLVRTKSSNECIHLLSKCFKKGSHLK